MSDDPSFEEMLEATLVRKFSVTVDVATEFEPEYSTREMDYARWVSLDGLQFRVRGTSITFRMNENRDSHHLEMTGLEARDEDDAEDVADEILQTLSGAISMHMQRGEEWQDEGHVRLRWSKATIRVEPYRHRLPARGGLGRYRYVGTEGQTEIQKLLDGSTASDKLGSLLQTYHHALGPVGHSAKFYYAFSFIEYIEDRFRNVSPRLLSKSKRTQIAECVKNVAAPEKTGRILDTLHGALSRMTEKNRNEKLLLILTKQLSLTALAYRGEQVSVDETLVKDLIDTRNSLFHASGGPTDIKRISDLAILTMETGLRALLAGSDEQA